MALHAARRIALQMIFARMFHAGETESVLKDLPDMENILEDQDFIDDALLGTQSNAQEYDRIIQSLSPERALERIPVLDRAILQLSLYELSLKEASPGIVINEAVELAKRFGDESDSRFINGVLGNYVRSLNPTE